MPKQFELPKIRDSRKPEFHLYAGGNIYGAGKAVLLWSALVNFHRINEE